VPGCSGTVLADIELIVKDVLRKQALIIRLDPSLPVNTVVGTLR